MSTGRRNAWVEWDKDWVEKKRGKGRKQKWRILEQPHYGWSTTKLYSANARKVAHNQGIYYLENIWKTQFCISYKKMQQNTNWSTSLTRDNMQHLNLETKNKKAYLTTKFKTIEDQTWEDFQSLLQFHNVPKMCGLSISSIRICSRE